MIPASSTMQAPTLLAGPSGATAVTVVGASGSGKTYRVWLQVGNDGQEHYKIYIDPLRQITGGVEKVEQIDFSMKYLNILYINLDNIAEFTKLVQYCFDLYERQKYPERIVLIIDELDIFCRNAPEDVILLYSKARKYFNVVGISQRVQMLNCANFGNVPLTQSRLKVFHMLDSEYDFIEEKTGRELSPEIRAFLNETHDEGGKPVLNHNFAVLPESGEIELHRGAE